MAYNPIYRVVLEKGKVDITEKVTKIHYEDCTEEDDIVTITLEGLTNDWIDDKAVNKGAEISYIFGFQGRGLSGKRVGIIKDFEVAYDATITGTITALDQGYLFKKLTSSRIFEYKTSSSIIEEIAKEFGIPCKVEPTDMIHIKEPMGNMTYWKFMQKLTANAGSGGKGRGVYQLFVRNGTLSFMCKDLSKKSARTFTWNNGNGEVISFKPKYEQAESTNEANGVTIAGIDPVTNKPFTVNAVPGKEVAEGEEQTTYRVDTEGKGKSDSQGYSFPELDPGKINIGTMRMRISSTMSMKSSSLQADYIQKKAVSTELTATLVILGDTSVEADTIISMAGVAKKFSGNWYVKKVIHDVDDNGFQTELELTKNGSKKSGTETDGKNSDVNKSTGKDGADKSKEVKQVNWSVDGTNKKGSGAGGSW